MFNSQTHPICSFCDYSRHFWCCPHTCSGQRQLSVKSTIAHPMLATQWPWGDIWEEEGDVFLVTSQFGSSSVQLACTGAVFRPILDFRHHILVLWASGGSFYGRCYLYTYRMHRHFSGWVTSIQHKHFTPIFEVML